MQLLITFQAIKKELKRDRSRDFEKQDERILITHKIDATKSKHLETKFREQFQKKDKDVNKSMRDDKWRLVDEMANEAFTKLLFNENPAY